MTEIISIVAMSDNNVIADENGIPWDIEKDMRHYMSKVRGNITISGRKTFESISSDFVGEHQIVLTRNKDWTYDNEKVHKCHSTEDALELAKKIADDDQDIYVIGGESVYREFLDTYDKMIVSHIPGNYDGSVYYPEFDKSSWNIKKKILYENFKVIWYERDI